MENGEGIPSDTLRILIIALKAYGHRIMKDLFHANAAVSVAMERTENSANNTRRDTEETIMDSKYTLCPSCGRRGSGRYAAKDFRDPCPDPFHVIADAAPELLAACKEFVRKCECGEARSVRSYAQMRTAIALAERREP
jgi:hypothetical protein